MLIIKNDVVAFNAPPLFQQIIAQPGYGQDVRDVTNQTDFSIPRLEFSDLGDPRVTKGTKSASGQSATGGEDDVHFHRHTSKTRELYGQMFSELGIPKPRALSVGPSPPSSRLTQPTTEAVPINRPVSPAPRSLDNSILSPQQHKGLSIRPISPVGLPATPSGLPSTPSISAQHHGLHGQSILTVDMFSKEQLNAIFNLAQTFRLCIQKERSLDHILKVCVPAALHVSPCLVRYVF